MAVFAAKHTLVVPGVSSEGPLPFTPRVQGMDSSLDDVRLYGRSWRAEVSDGLRGAKLERSIEGASTLTLTIHDPRRRLLSHTLLQSQFDVELDELWFRFVRAEKQDAHTLLLTFEDREVARLRARTGARKAYRDQVTRAEFALRLLREERPAIPFYCPELHTRQPIADAKEERANRDAKQVRREPGLSSQAKFTIKGIRADGTQIRNCDRVLDVGRSLKAPEKVLISAIATGIVESLCRNLPGGDSDSAGFFQQRPSAGWGPPGDLVRDARQYYQGIPGHAGALGVYRRDPKISMGALCQKVQVSAFPERYAQYAGEAEKIVRLYLGGTDAEATEPAAAENKRYAFERGAKESTWAAHGRLAEEVNWRRFVSAGIEYFVAETHLLRSMPRALITDASPGVEEITGGYDMGTPATELTVRARARAWAAPPGSVVEVEGNGPLDGRYLASAITGELGRPISPVEITLKRPTPPLPEPAPESKSKRSKGRRRLRSAGGGDASGPIRKIIDEIDRIDKMRLTYVFGGGHGSSPAPRNGPFDCSSFVSHLIQLIVPDFPTQATGTLIGAGRSGPGREFTFYVKNGGPGGGHTFVGVKDGGTWRYAGTSSSNPGGGPGWFSASSGYRAGFSQRHIGNL